MPSAAQSRSRPSSASAWFEAMTSGQPPGTWRRHPVDRRGECQETGRVGRADPVELGAETRPPGERGVGTMRHDQRMDPVAAILADPQDGGALRPTQPFVPVARPVRGAERAHIDRHHPGGVGGVHERVDAAPVELRDEVGDREDEPRDAGHLADDDQPRPWRDGAQDRLQHDLRTIGREGDRHDDDPRPIAGRHCAHRVDGRVVLVVVRQEFVARLETERLEHGVVAGRGVRHELETLGVRAEEPPDRDARLVEQPRQVARQEPDRLGLESVPECLLDMRGPAPGTPRTSRG